jgi:uncharacterized protein YlaI
MKPRSFEHRRHLSEALKGNTNWLGKHHTEATKAKISQIHLGERSSSWKGDNVKYVGLHTWVRRRLSRPDLCQICNKVPSQDLANVTGNYNRDFSNWQYLCRSCHQILDFKTGIRDRDKISEYMKGHIVTSETRRKIGNSNRGKSKPTLKGRSRPQDTLLKVSLTRRIKMLELI